MSKAKWQKLPRKPHRSSESYRAARKAEAKRRQLIWRELPRTQWNGGVFVVVPVA